MMPQPPEGDTAQAIRRAAVRATLAPSVHNTQPWTLRLTATSLEIYADWDRRLRVLDPRGRQLLLSCGCAVFNARVALAAAGFQVWVDRFPDPLRPNLIARLTPVPGPPIAALVDQPPIDGLDEVVPLRHTNRRRFLDESMPTEIIQDLISVAAVEGAELFAIDSPEHRLATARLSREADSREHTDPAYRAELRAWTSEDPGRLDGVTAMTVPHVDGCSGDELPVRDFDTHGMGRLPAQTHSSVHQCLLLLGTQQDSTAAWLQAGEALQHVLLEATRRGYVASPLTQVIEVAAANAELRTELGLTMHPHVLLRVGRAAVSPASRRRRLVDVLDESR